MKNLKDMLNESRGDIDKDIKKKAEEIRLDYTNGGYRESVYGADLEDALNEMAEWMKSYMIEKAIDKLDYVFDLYEEIKDWDVREDFRKAMEK